MWGDGCPYLFLGKTKCLVGCGHSVAKIPVLNYSLPILAGSKCLPHLIQGTWPLVVHKGTRAHTDTHMYTHTYTHMHTKTCIYTQTCMWAYTCTHVARDFGGRCWLPIRHLGIHRKSFLPYTLSSFCWSELAAFLGIINPYVPTPCVPLCHQLGDFSQCTIHFPKVALTSI